MPVTKFERYTPRLLAAWPGHARHQTVTGTMVFCDISGFTALSERLAKKGRVGSEEVAAALTSVFSELLDIAIGRGGDLLKFGGDALLLLFTGPDHTVRAAASAFEMQRRLATVGEIDTGSGRITLTMTVGIHTGNFEMFLAGDRHRELIVAGTDASATVRTEESAESSQIVVSDAASAALDASLLDASSDGRNLLARPPQAPDLADGTGRLRTELGEYLPTALRSVVGTPASDGEHRRAVVAFLKFGGLDNAIAERGATAVGDDLDATIRVVQAAADEFGVTFLASDIDADGGKVILIAGAPATSENDAERLLRALRMIAEADPPLPLKMGANAGTLFAGDVGSTARAAYTVMGDAVNLAARIMGQAQPGQILVETGVLERSSTTFKTKSVDPFLVKGKSDAVQAVVIGRVEGTQEKATRDELPLAGRTEALKAIVSEFAEVPSVGVRLLEVTGPAGSGKSRLLGEAREQTDPDAWIKVGCERYEASTPNHALRGLLRGLLGIPREADPVAAGVALTSRVTAEAKELTPWLPLLAVPAGAEVEPTPEATSLVERFRKERTQEATLDLLDALLPRPAAVLFDNAQWLDDSSRATIERAAANPAGRPWLLCLSSRDPLGLPDETKRVELEPLSASEGLELARAVAAEHPVPHHRLVEAVERSGGSPLFLISLAEAALETGELPANIEDLINARIDRLEPGPRKVLRYASVIGRNFRPELLIASIGDEVPEAESGDIWAELHEYLEPLGTGERRFRQNLFHEVAYAGLPFRLRRQLHLRVGAALESEGGDRAEMAALLSQHFSLGDDPARAWHYSEQAGRQAADAFSYVDAIELLERAMAAAKRLPELKPVQVAEVAEALGDASDKAGLFDNADKAYAAARKLFGDQDVALARILGKQGLIRERAGSYTVALRWLGRGLRALESAAPSSDAEAEKMELLLRYSGVRYRQGRYHDCIGLAQQALDLGPSEKAEAHARYLLALAFAHLADPASQTEGERALEIYEATGDRFGKANVLNNLGLNAYYRGEWDDALEYWESGRTSYEASGDILGSAMSTNNLGEIYSDQGRYQEGREAFSEALSIWEGANYGVGMALASSNLGRVEARSHNHDTAQQWFERAEAGFEEIGAATYVLDTRVRIAENLVFEARPEAESAVRELLTAAGDTAGATVLEATLHRLLGYALRQTGDANGAAEAFAASIEKAEEGGAPYEEAQSRRALGDLLADAEQQAAASTIFERMGVIRLPEIPVMSQQTVG